ncbi:unnamed protein product [Rhizoctonia solani]|uniref:Uncharacterized protein n=1 Tax=Rhizoctonia solani TaxID=456999 RepID=A0A8H3CR22_9AGAM|nr:unnamed protein product [Rhizoctonia solani]
MTYDANKHSFPVALILYLWSTIRFPLNAVLGSFFPKLTTPQVDLWGKTAIVTGANSGIGFNTARALAGMGAHVILACRNELRGQEARTQIIELTGNSKVDLEILDFDILVNNAAIMLGTLSLTPDNFEQTYQTNHLAHLLLAHELLDRGHFSPTARIVSLTSGGMHYSPILNEKNGQGWDVVARYDNEVGRKMSANDMIQLYVRTKLSQVMWTIELQRRLDRSEKWKNVTAHCCHPGFVQTPIWSQPAGFGATSGFAIDFLTYPLDMLGVPGEQGAMLPVWLATAPEPATERLKGMYWDRKHWQWLAPWALDEQRQKMLWDMWCRDAKAPSI